MVEEVNFSHKTLNFVGLTFFEACLIPLVVLADCCPVTWMGATRRFGVLTWALGSAPVTFSCCETSELTLVYNLLDSRAYLNTEIVELLETRIAGSARSDRYYLLRCFGPGLLLRCDAHTVLGLREGAPSLIKRDSLARRTHITILSFVTR